MQFQCSGKRPIIHEDSDRFSWNGKDGSATGPKEGLGSCELPCFADEVGEQVVRGVAEFNADPAFDANIGRFEVNFRRFGDHLGLGAGRGGDPDGGVAVRMVVVGEHDKDALGDEEGGFAVRELFADAGQGEGEAADAVNVGPGGHFEQGNTSLSRAREAAEID